MLDARRSTTLNAARCVVSCFCNRVTRHYQLNSYNILIFKNQQNPTHPYPKLKEKKVCWDAFCFATDAAPAGVGAAAEAAAPAASAASAAASDATTALAVIKTEAAAEAAGATASAAPPAPAGAASVAKQKASQQTFFFF